METLWLYALRTRVGGGGQWFVKVRPQLCLRLEPFSFRHKHSAGSPLVLGSTCGVPLADSQVVATPTKATYEIGETVSLSCPAGSVLEGGASEVRCTPSLQWSPSPSRTSCVAGKAPCFLQLKRRRTDSENRGSVMPEELGHREVTVLRQPG